MENINKVSISWVGNFSSPIIEFVKTLAAFPQSAVAMSPARHNFTLSNQLKQLLFPVFPPSHFFYCPTFHAFCFLCVWHLSLLCYTFCRWLPFPSHLTTIITVLLRGGYQIKAISHSPNSVGFLRSLVLGQSPAVQSSRSWFPDLSLQSWISDPSSWISRMSLQVVIFFWPLALATPLWPLVSVMNIWPSLQSSFLLTSGFIHDFLTPRFNHDFSHLALYLWFFSFKASISFTIFTHLTSVMNYWIPCSRQKKKKKKFLTSRFLSDILTSRFSHDIHAPRFSSVDFRNTKDSANSLAPTCLQPVSNLSPTCLQHVSNMSPTCLQRVSNLSPTCLQPASSQPPSTKTKKGDGL